MSVCEHCQCPLILEIEASDDDQEMPTEGSSSAAAQTPNTVPDDVHLRCGCHFHWECLLDADQMTQCPNCSQQINSRSAEGEEVILCNLHNEGGLQENLDILPLLKEESYLRAYPGARKACAFLDFCREGDFGAIAELIKDCELESEVDTILRYQDNLGDMQSGLHAAVSGGSREVAWLLLLLASQYPELEFPALVFQEAATLGLMRFDQENKVDIRTLRDSQGRTAEQLAMEIGGVWHGWPGTGRLTVAGS